MEAQGPERLTARQLADAAPVPVEELERLIARGMLKPGTDGSFARGDIQRVRAVFAMLSPGISLDELYPAFEAGYFTLEPIEMLFPAPSAATRQTFAELAAELRLDMEQLSRMVVAAGFPAPRADDRVREDDAQLVRDVVQAGRLFGGGGELTLRVARILGESARRAAEAGLGLFEEGDERRRGEHRMAMRDPELRRDLNDRGGRLMRLTEDLIARLYRRHLEHGLLRVWSGAAEVFLDELGIRPAPRTPPVLAFVDLAGFTALTEQAGDATAARLAALLAELAERSAAAHDGRVVKLLGDGAMLHFGQPPDAARAALDLVTTIGRSDLPPARGGVHAGPVIERDGDYFGRTVNIAARAAAQAQPGQVVASEQVASTAATDLRFAPLGEREMKGLGRMLLFEVAWAAS